MGLVLAIAPPGWSTAEWWQKSGGTRQIGRRNSLFIVPLNRLPAPIKREKLMTEAGNI